MRASAVLLVLLCGFLGCKKSSPTNLSSPEKTLESFFSALNESRIPDELNTFVIDEFERAAWRMRCETRGCKKGNYSILEVLEKGENGARLKVDYRVMGDKKRTVMQGKGSVIRLERHNSKWGISQFGKRLSAPKKPPTPPSEPPRGDAAPEIDGNP